MKGWMYILKCNDDSYYTGSTNNLELRLAQHQAGLGANHTRKRLPVELVYYEEFPRIDQAFYREKQIQRWNRKKKEALIKCMPHHLKKAAECMNDTHYKNFTSTPLSDPTSTSFSDPTSTPLSDPTSTPFSDLDSDQ